MTTTKVSPPAISPSPAGHKPPRSCLLLLGGASPRGPQRPLPLRLPLMPPGQRRSRNNTRRTPMPPTRNRTALELPSGGAPACSWGGDAPACSWGGGVSVCSWGGEAIPPVSAWGAGGRGTSASAWGGGGRGTSASGVGTWAVSGLPQLGQTCSSGRSWCPQSLQYLCATTVILPLLENSKIRSRVLHRC